MATSNEELVSYLTQCEADELPTLTGLMRSRLSKESRLLAKELGTPDQVPSAGSKERMAYAKRIVALLGWYGSNTTAYTFRRITKSDAAKPYTAIARDVAHLIRSNLAKNDRPKIPRTPSITELEEAIVSMCLTQTLSKLSTEEIEQILREAGLEDDVISHNKRKYGPALAGAGLPVLVRVLGKKAVTQILEKVILTATGKFVSKEAGLVMAKRLMVKFPQKFVSRSIAFIGWALLASDILMFVTAPSRRFTIRAVPFIAICRTRARLSSND